MRCPLLPAFLAALFTMTLPLAACSGGQPTHIPVDPGFGCSTHELYRGEKLVVQLPMPHAEDFAVVDPDGRLYYVAVVPGLEKRPGLEPALERRQFREMDRLDTSPAEAVGAPQEGQGAGRKPIFTKSGRYRILLGDNLGTRFQNVQGQCEVLYHATPRPTPGASPAATPAS